MMDKPLPPSFRQIGDILAPELAAIFARAEARAEHDKTRIMAGLLVGLGLDLNDELRCLQFLVVDRIWPGPRQEVEKLFEQALNIARHFKESGNTNARDL